MTTTKNAERAYFPKLAAERPDIALCRVSAAITRRADAHAAATGVGTGQHLVLKMLAEVGPCSQRVLSEELRIDRSVMVGICDSLEQDGHLRRERDATDRRAYAVTITTSGKRLLKRAEATVPALLDDAFHGLTPDERERLTALLSKLI